jgi:hypothetical protein
MQGTELRNANPNEGTNRDLCSELHMLFEHEVEDKKIK